MTCVIGLSTKDRVYIGVDSAAVAGWICRATNVRKLFRRGPFLMGYTTSFRMGQLLEHQLKVPVQKSGQSDMEFMVTRFVENVRTMLKDKGFSKVESNKQSGGQFLVAYKGQLYCIHKDFQVGQMSEGLECVGSGADFALGAMKALDQLPPVPRIKRALAIAAHFNMGVCPPFYVRSMKKPGSEPE